MKKLTFSILFLLQLLTLHPGLEAAEPATLEECVELAVKNYPAIRKFGLLKESEKLGLEDVDKSWLPRLAVNLQGGVQNVTVSLPDELLKMMAQMGQSYEGIGLWQYKGGVDISQKVWDGGMARKQKEVIRAENLQKEASLNVDLYAVRQRIESLYFGILLSQAQCAQLDNAIMVIDANIQRLRVCVNNGVALNSDLDLLEVQKLTIIQQKDQALSSQSALRGVLEAFTGIPVKGELSSPPLPTSDSAENNRPELRLFESAQNLNNRKIEALKSSLFPQAALFAQSFYGYPGLNYFESMSSRKPSFNLVAGLKMSWNLDAFYTYDNSRRRLQTANEMIDADRETFLFNTGLQGKSQSQEIKAFENLIASDRQIVELREKIRKTAEAQLSNGVIDPTALLLKINDETQARLNAELHQIQYLQSVYNLKYTLNR